MIEHKRKSFGGFEARPWDFLENRAKFIIKEGRPKVTEPKENHKEHGAPSTFLESSLFEQTCLVDHSNSSIASPKIAWTPCQWIAFKANEFKYFLRFFKKTAAKNSHQSLLMDLERGQIKLRTLPWAEVVRSWSWGWDMERVSMDFESWSRKILICKTWYRSRKSKSES